MKIPRRFELYGRTIRVVFGSLNGAAYAQWEFAKDLITIDPDAPRDHRDQAFLHEFIHAALESLGREDLSIDEKFVDGLAGLVHQMLKSSK